jgi:hypothetical protein
MFRLLILSFTILVVAAPAIAQDLKTMQEMQQMQAAMIAAQAKSIRLGDEAMSCQAIEKELVTSMNDPAIQTYAAKAGATVEKDLAVLEKAKKPMTLEAALAMATGLDPTGGLVQDQAAMMKQLVAIMPQLMRSQRLVQLAFVKQCAWATGANPFAPQLRLDEVTPQRQR